MILLAQDVADSTQTLTIWLVVLATASIVTLALQRLKLSVIPGYIIAGALISPLVDRMVGGTQTVEHIADLAIILLMFGIGLHIDIADARRGMVSLIGIGVLSTIGSCVLGYPVALALGLPPPAAIVAVMVLSMSSTAAVMRMLQQRRELKQLHGRLCFGVLLVQDLLVVVMLAAIPIISLWSGAGEVDGEIPFTLTQLIAKTFLTVGGVGLLIVGGMAVLPRMMAVVAKGARADVLLVFAAAVAIGAAAVTSSLGLSPELGAFLAGFLLAATPFRHQVSGQLAPMRDLFMAIFFTAVGLDVSAHIVAQYWWVVGLVVVCLVVIKTLAIGVAAWSFGASGPISIRSAMALAQGGEFGLIVLAAAGGAGPLLDEQTEAILVGAIAVSLVFTPMLMTAGERWAVALRKAPTAPWVGRFAMRDSPVASPDRPDALGHVIIAGFGPVGRATADQFKRLGVAFVVVELNPRTVERQTKLGRAIVYGDVTNAAVLESAGIEHAAAIVLTMPDDQAVLRACTVIRQLAPDIFIAARMTFMSKAITAKQIGADYVIAEEIATAEAMAKHVAGVMTARVSQ